MSRLDRDRLKKRTKDQILDEVEDTLAQGDDHLRAMARSSIRMARGNADEAAAEIARLTIEKADLERRLEMALQENRRLRGETTSAFNINTRQEP